MIIVIESDSHGGNVFGLANPASVRDVYKPFAKLLFDWREKKIRDIGKIDMLLHLGEITDGPGRRSTIELYTTDSEAQAEDAADLLCMWDCDDFRLCYGTNYHTGKDSKTERMVVDKIKLRHNKRADIKGIQRLEVEGVKINAKHHVGASGTGYGKPSQLAKAAINDMLKGVYRNFPGADLYFRAHTHEYAFAGTDLYAAYNNPALQWPLGEYGLKIDRPYYTMGFLVLTIANKRWTVTPHLFKVRLPEEVYAVVGDSNGDTDAE